jgi:hypothetical protein
MSLFRARAAPPPSRFATRIDALLAITLPVVAGLGMLLGIRVWRLFADASVVNARRPRPPERVASEAVISRQASPVDEDAAADFAKRRARYLATFVPFGAENATLYVEPTVSSEAANATRACLSLTHELVAHGLGIDAAPPATYLYPNVAELRKYSSSLPYAVSYYDGAIHISVTSSEWLYREICRSVRHEYAHHALMSNGIVRPMWLQEGVALRLAGERDWHGERRDWTDHPLTVAQMIDGLPDTPSESSAHAFYGQAYAMLEFLNRLCADRTECGERELVAALKTGSATPETLFDWAVAHRATRLPAGARPSLWGDYVTSQGFARVEMVPMKRAQGFSL